MMNINLKNALSKAQDYVTKIPRVFLVTGAVAALAVGAGIYMEESGPAYAVLNEGLTPAQGGKVIAALQKLGIPYKLQAQGNIIMVPQPQLAQARLQLGQSDVPGDTADDAWNKVESAPMTSSDLAQTTMANRAVEQSLQESIEKLSGIQQADVYVAIPDTTPFLADQPKPTASVVITASNSVAQAQAVAIANLVQGSIPGISASNITVETNTGVSVYPQNNSMATAAQMETISEIEADASLKIQDLLAPMVGKDNFRVGVSANVDFTKISTQQVSYGPGHLIEHQTSDKSDQYDNSGNAIGIPGAISNEPPAATNAAAAPIPQNTPGAGANANNQAGQGGVNGKSGNSKNSTTPLPMQSDDKLDQNYQNDQSVSDIVKPDWQVQSLNVSVVVNKASLKGVTEQQIQTALEGALDYPAVKVNVLTAPFDAKQENGVVHVLVSYWSQITHSALELIAAIFFLFGMAIPIGRRLSAIDLERILTPAEPYKPMPEMPKALPIIQQRRDYSDLKANVAENPSGVAKLLQSLVSDDDNKQV